MPAAARASRAKTANPLLKAATGMALSTPGACASAPARPRVSGAARLTLTSAPVAKAARSSWDCRQL